MNSCVWQTKEKKNLPGQVKEHKGKDLCIHCKNSSFGGLSLKDYIEERAIEIANYIVKENATVRQTAKKFGVSKSTVHTVVIK